MSTTTGDNGLGDGSAFQSVDWDDRKVRHTFIRKVSPKGPGAPVRVEGQVLTPRLLQVYAIISLQLLVTVGIISVFTFV